MALIPRAQGTPSGSEALVLFTRFRARPQTAPSPWSSTTWVAFDSVGSLLERHGLHHFVLIMMENRSFDHYLRALDFPPGARGQRAALG